MAGACFWSDCIRYVECCTIAGNRPRYIRLFESEHRSCIDYPYYTDSARARIDLRLGDVVADDPDYSVSYSFPQSDDLQPYLIEEVLLSGDSAGWACLADGAGQIGLTDDPVDVDYQMGYPCGSAGVPITVDAATLVVTYDPALPTSGVTWGTLKQIYR